MYNPAELIIDIPTGCGEVWPREMHETLILVIYLPYLNMCPWELRKTNLLVGMGRYQKILFKENYYLGGCAFHNFARKRVEWTPCRLVSCKIFYHAAPTLPFTVNKPLRDKYMYYKIRKDDYNMYLMARKGDWFLALY